MDSSMGGKGMGPPGVVHAGKMVTIRAAKRDDVDFLTDMWVAAANAPDRHHSRAELLADPEIRRYIEDWPRPTDRGVAAVDGEPVGAAWFRFFLAEGPAYGFVGPDVPELAIGVVAKWRGRGVGRGLLRALAAEARAAGVRQLSLSVEHTNPAAALYRSEGYRVVASRANANTMLLDL